jgi:hypothetical protein
VAWWGDNSEHLHLRAGAGVREYNELLLRRGPQVGRWLEFSLAAVSVTRRRSRTGLERWLKFSLAAASMTRRPSRTGLER